MRIYFKDLILCLIFHFILDGSNLVYGCITEEDCQVSNVKTSFLSSGTGLFEWESPEENTDECCNVTVFIASLSTNNSDALKWHNVKDENQKTIWNDNDIEPNLNSITKTDLTFLMCVDYKFSIQAKCVVKQNGQTQNRNESYLPGVISGPTVEKVFKGYSSQLFKNITIDVNKNNTLNITFDPSSVLTLCIPEYQLEIYDGHIDNPMNCSSVNCKIMEMKLINQTSVLLNTNFKNGITLKQCNYYTAFIKLLDPNAAGIYQSLPFIFDYTEKSDNDWKVNSFRVNTTGPDWFLLTWLPPLNYSECVINYVVRVYDDKFRQLNYTTLGKDTIKFNVSEETGYIITPCTNYYFCLIISGKRVSVNSTINGTTQNIAPGEVSDIAITNITSHSMTVVWAKPTYGLTCAVYYALEFTDNSGSLPVIYVDLNETIYVKYNLKPCVQYGIGIRTKGTEKDSQQVVTDGTTSPEVPGAVQTFYISEMGANDLSLTWTMPAIYPECVIYYNISWYTYVDQSFVNSVKITDPHVNSLKIDNLEPCWNYTFAIYCGGIIGISQLTNLSAFTNEKTPNAPTNVHVLEKTSYSLEISWDKPTLIPGVLEEYNISIICAGPQYSVPETCTSKIITPSYWVTLSGFAEKALLERLLPYQKCTITVAAATGAGYGPISEPHVTFTLPNVSEVVRDVEVAVLYNESVLMWYAPCFSNGIISHFSIKLKGTREGFEPDPVLILNKLYDPDKPDLRYEQHLENLLPEYDYEVTISVFVNSVSNTCPAIINFKSSARIPEVPSESSLQIVNPNPKATDSPSENAKITLTKTLFNNKDGVIKYLAVLVGHEGLLGPGQSGLLIGEDGKCEWPNVRTWANATQESDVPIYQATPAWWNPFKEGSVEDKIDYVIGSESCSRDDVNVFCNGPLNPSTSYELKIRAFTSAGYQDSPSIMFVTDAAFPYDFLIKSIISFFVVIIFVLIIVAFVILRRSTWLAAIKKPNRLVTPQPQKDEEISDEMYLKELSVKKFLIHCNELLNDINKMKAEFLRLNTLSTQIELSCLAAQLPENKNKNRYINVFPYDSTRVVLEDYNDTDYINASYVSDDIDKSIEYIACQAPKDDTIDDFWKMIYQCKVQSIVMLCNFTEQGKQKCYSYIPEDNKIINSDGLTIVCTHKRVYSSHVERILSITKDDQVVSRAVTHFHFVDWPDFGVPAEAETMLNFCKAIRSASIGIGMVAVHCSAGIGRTGTYIATDILLRHIDLPVKISVFRTVLILREQRANMVQTEVQYSYIYKCLKYALDHPLLYFKRGRSVFESKRSRNKHNSRRGSRFSIASSITSR